MTCCDDVAKKTNLFFCHKMFSIYNMLWINTLSCRRSLISVDWLKSTITDVIIECALSDINKHMAWSWTMSENYVDDLSNFFWYLQLIVQMKPNHGSSLLSVKPKLQSLMMTLWIMNILANWEWINFLVLQLECFLAKIVLRWKKIGYFFVWKFFTFF